MEDLYLPKQFINVRHVSFRRLPSGRSPVEIVKNNSPAIRNLIPQSHLGYPSFQRQFCCIGCPSGLSDTLVVNEKTLGLNEAWKRMFGGLLIQRKIRFSDHGNCTPHPFPVQLFFKSMTRICDSYPILKKLFKQLIWARSLLTEHLPLRFKMGDLKTN